MKILLLVVALTSMLFSQTTMCYKKNLPTEKIYENISLQGGGSCQGKSINQLENLGWKLKDSKITKNKLGVFDHIYIFSKRTKLNAILQPKQLSRNVFDSSVKKYILSNTTSTGASIDDSNIKVGQTGVIIHTNNMKNTIILTNAVVKVSNNNSTTIQFIAADILTQDAIPTSNLKPKDGDIFILHHLYNTSLLIVPNLESKQIVKSFYKKQNFINEDFFATYLKMGKNPSPSKQDIKKFCQINQIGTIFIVIKDKLYILDALTFNLLDTQYLNISSNDVSVPFFTKIKDIQKGFWDILDRSKIEDYNSYYNAMINNSVYIPKNLPSNRDTSIIKTIKDLWPW